MARSPAQFQLTPEQQKLVEDNVNLARREAWRYQRRTEIDYKILESVAFEGLCQAANRYDPTMLNPRTGQPMKFSSIAVPYTRGSILHYIRDKTYILKLSHRMREHWLQGRKLLYAGKSDLEIAETLGIELVEWLETRVTCSGPPLELKEQGAPTIDAAVEEQDLGAGYLEAAAQYCDAIAKTDRGKLTAYFTTNSKRIPEDTAQAILDRTGFIKRS